MKTPIPCYVAVVNSGDEICRSTSFTEVTKLLLGEIRKRLEEGLPIGEKARICTYRGEVVSGQLKLLSRVCDDVLLHDACGELLREKTRA